MTRCLLQALEPNKKPAGLLLRPIIDGMCMSAFLAKRLRRQQSPEHRQPESMRP